MTIKIGDCVGVLETENLRRGKDRMDYIVENEGLVRTFRRLGMNSYPLGRGSSFGVLDNAIAVYMGTTRARSLVSGKWALVGRALD